MLSPWRLLVDNFEEVTDPCSRSVAMREDEFKPWHPRDGRRVRASFGTNLSFPNLALHPILTAAAASATRFGPHEMARSASENRLAGLGK